MPKFLLSYLVIFTSLCWGAVTVTPKEFAELKAKYQGALPERKGQGEDDWNKIIQGIKEFKDEDMLKATLAHYPAPGIQFERHRVDIKEVFNHDPLFTITAANKVFENNQDCLLSKMLPQSEQISYTEVRPALTASIAKLEKENNKADLKVLEDFRDKADKHYKAVKKKAVKLKTGHCQMVSSKHVKK